MEWTLDYLEKDKIVSAKIIGVMDWDQHKQFAEEAFSLARKNGSHKLLIDFLEMEPNFTILQIDDLPKLLKEIGIGPEFKIAAIHDFSSPKSSEHIFFRNAATIMSLQVKQFSDKDSAIAWLKSEQ
jgi:hypothetical protein